MLARNVEVLVGVFVALGFAALLMLSLQVSNLVGTQINGGYELVVHFENIGGLKVRSPVSASGVVVGRVADIQYQADSYQAKVTVEIDDRFRTFPLDTSASILTAGLLGEQYIGLQPGAEDDYLLDGDEITITQSAIILERVISQFLFSKAAE